MNIADCRLGRLPGCDGTCEYCLGRCLSDGGPGLTAAHQCSCIREKDHPLDSSRPHRCGCGSVWSVEPRGGLVVLTGATGFVGRQVLRHLLKAGCSVRVLVRDPSRVELGGDVEVVATPDLFAEPPDRLGALLDGAHTLVHAAWYAEPGKYLGSTRNLDCLTGTLTLARAFATIGGRRFVGVGTCAEYDTSPGMLATETPLAPSTLYAACKAAAFLTLRSFFAASETSFAWCRLFYLYGEGEDERRLVPYVRRQLSAGEEVLLTRGEQVRDFLDVEKAARMITDVALGHHAGPVNICSGVGITVRELAEQIADEYGGRGLLRFGAKPENAFDPPRVIGVRGAHIAEA